MNPIIQKAVEDRFDQKFAGYWKGTAIPDEIKFFIKFEIKMAINNTVLQMEEMVEAKRLSRIRGIGVAEWDAHNLKARIIDEVIDGLRSSLDKLKV